MKTGRFFIDLHGDLRFGVRLLRRNPGFTAVAVITLALGIGANTAIFSAVNGILLQPLPYADPAQLVRIQREQIAYHVTTAQWREIQEQCTALERIAAYSYRELLIIGGKVPTRVSAGYVSGDFFPMLGVKPLLGRFILPEDTQPGNDRVAVLNHGFWMNEFGGDVGIVGHSISVNHNPYTVIGVMPREFGVGIHWSYLIGSDAASRDGMWVPWIQSPSVALNREASPIIIARLKKHATPTQADAQLQPLSARFAAAYPAGTQGLHLHARSLDPGIDPRVRTGLLILLGAVGFVLLMACVNVTSLLVARSWTRQRELAIRKALGATRPRVLRQFLSESLLLAMAGGAMGLFFSLWGIRLLRVLAPPYTPRADRILLDANVLWFTAGISLLVAVLVGFAPAVQASSRRIGDVLKAGLGGSFAGVAVRQPQRLRSALVVVEVLLAVIVVVGATLMCRSFYKLMRVNTGLSASRVLTVQVHFSDSVCNVRGSATTCSTATAEVLDGLRSLPGVRRVCLGSPFNGGGIGHYPGSGRSGLYIEGQQGDQLPGDQWIFDRFVTPGFFAALGIRILKGRDFEPADRASSVAIVSEGFARKYIPGDPLGRRFSINEDEGGHHSWMEIIGVVNDVRDHAVKGPPGPVFYMPFAFVQNSEIEIVAQTAADPMPLVPEIVRVIRSVDKDAPITHIQTVDQIIANSAAEPRFQTAVITSFGALGLLLAVIGIYGVISYSVVERTHEIGVRMALGAQRKDVLRMILKEGLLLAVIGIFIGIGGAWGLTRVLRNILFEIEPTDPLTFIGVSIFLTVAALAACCIPARRAMKVDPLAALRHE